MDLDVSVKSVYELFSGKNVYKIPNYQRSYSWKKEQFKEFFEDLLDTSGINKDQNEASDSNRYFFGMISLIGDMSNPDPKKPYSVIDGQQRITTMQLFYIAIQETIDNLNKELSDEEKYSTDIEDRLICKMTNNGQSESTMRLVKGTLNPHYSVEILNFEGRKEDGARVDPKSQEQLALGDAYEAMKKHISKSNISKKLGMKPKELDDERYKKILDNLGKHLGNSQVICIYHKNPSDAHTLFRNLNSRGVVLNKVDLIKSDIFSNLSHNDGYVDDRWATIERNTYDINESIQTFFYHFLSSRHKEITTTNLFEKYNKYYKDEEGELEGDFLENLKDASELYKAMIQPDDNETLFKEERYFSNRNHPSIKRNLVYLTHWGLSQYRPLVLTLFECREKDIIDNRYLKKMIDLVAFNQCIFLIAKANAKDIRNVYNDITFSLRKIDINGDIPTQRESIYRDFKKELLENLPDKNSIINKKLKYSCKPMNVMSKDELKEFEIIRFILSKLAESNQGDSNHSNDALKFISDASLEHIIDRENQGDDINLLGNILLIEQNLHDDKKEWDDKLAMYSRSNIKMTNTFANEYPNFEKKDILKRNKKLLEEFYSLVEKMDKS